MVEVGGVAELIWTYFVHCSLGLGGCNYRGVVERKDLVFAQSDEGIGFALVVAEFNFVDARLPGFYDCSDLTPDELVFR